MSHITRCIYCDKEWTPKNWENFPSICGVCVKSVTEQFERQFKPVPRLTTRLRVEDDGA